MRIDTTLNIHKTIMELIDSSSEIYGFTKNDIIIRLLKRAIDEYSELYYKGTRRIKYQKRDENKLWIPKHIYLSEAEYEYVNDIKKLYKMSISNILAYSVRNFFKSEIYEMIWARINKKSDNNRFSCYAVVMEQVENIICWKFYWGVPRNLSLLLPAKRE